jgi:multidrug efflux system outer membrane protein
MTKTRGTVLSLLAVLAAGCATLEPSLLLPPPPVAASWPLPETTAPAGTTAEPSTTEPASAVADIGWRDFFVDPHLERLIELALANNRDLRVAVLNVERARALHDIRRADQLPSVDGGAAYSRQRLSASQAGGARGETVSQASVEVGITSYELDLFGRVRSLSHSALEQFFASEEARRGAQLGLIAAVAETYLTLAADRELERLAVQTVASEEASFALTKQRYERGAVSGLEVSQAETTVANARVDAARFAGRVEQDANALAFLIGEPVDPTLLPGGFDTEVSGVAPLPAGLPAETLLRRPDVLAAEHLLRAANANIGAARAAFFPRIALTGSVGTASSQLGDLFGAGSGFWRFMPQISVPIFQGGRLRANRRAAEVDRDMAIAGYERAIQGAFREVADALALERSLARQRAAQQGLVTAAGRAFELSRARHESGRDSYLVALDSQRISYGSQQGLIVLRLAEQLNRIALYRALGGGWQERSE